MFSLSATRDSWSPFSECILQPIARCSLIPFGKSKLDAKDLAICTGGP
jgi:hypothetical protein